MIRLEQCAVILVQPRHPGNVGAVARAMKNMGVGDLRLVQSVDPLSDPARAMAAGATDILERAGHYPALHPAIEDRNLVVGCTARRGRERVPVFRPRGLVTHLRSYAPHTRVGLVFGREDRGLGNEDIELCQVLLTIPTAPGHRSLNLAQAVLVLCYELFCAEQEEPDHGWTWSTCTAGELEGLYRHLGELLAEIAFHPPWKRERAIRVLRRILGRAGLSSREAKTVRGIFRQLQWQARRHPAPPIEAGEEGGHARPGPRPHRGKGTSTAPGS